MLRLVLPGSSYQICLPSGGVGGHVCLPLLVDFLSTRWLVRPCKVTIFHFTLIVVLAMAGLRQAAFGSIGPLSAAGGEPPTTANSLPVCTADTVILPTPMQSLT